MAEDVPETDDLLAAYRRLKEERLKKSGTAPEEPAPEPVPEPQPTPAIAEAQPTPEATPRELEPQPEPAPEPEPAAPEPTPPIPSPPQVPPPAPVAPPAPISPPAPPAVATPAAGSNPRLHSVADPRDQAPVSAENSLAPQAPRLGLMHRLRADDLVTTSTNIMSRVSSWSVLALGMALLALDRWLTATRAPAMLGPIPVWILGVVVTLGGLIYLIATLFGSSSRRFNMVFANTQMEEWRMSENRVRFLRLTRWIGAGFGLGGPLWMIIWYSATSSNSTGAGAGVGITMGILGAATVLVTTLLLRLAVRAYIQSMLLSLLERSNSPIGTHLQADGTAASPKSDPRVQPVLKSLDALLGKLPESAVQQFLATPEAQTYLELIEGR